MNLPGVYKTFLDKWSSLDLQSCWIISDTHFGDQDLKAGIEKRPIDEDFVKTINAKCGKNDLLIHLGDVGDISYIRKIKAKYKILIMGNHDAGRTNYEPYFNEIFEGPVMMGEKLILSHEPVDVPWAFNIHGHDHAGTKRKNHLNVCADVIGYTPINMNQFMKSGTLAHIETIHRETIDKATVRKAKRGGRKI